MTRKKVMIPFSPVPYPNITRTARPFTGLGVVVARTFPYLEVELRQAKLPFKRQEYGAIMAFLFVFYFLAVGILGFLLTFKIAPEQALFMGPVLGGLAGLLVVVQLSMYPKMQVRKRVREIEKNLPFALRTMLVQVKSGVSLFDALNLIAQGDYGALSHEFKSAIDRIETGSFEEDALQQMALDNPSPYLRKAVWQLVNGMKAGADVSVVLGELVGAMANDQKIQIVRYGGALKILSLMYMMIGVILPAMGITLLIILSSFPQINIGDSLFWVLLVVVVIAEFMYLGMIKSKRPNLL